MNTVENYLSDNQFDFKANAIVSTLMDFPLMIQWLDTCAEFLLGEDNARPIPFVL